MYVRAVCTDRISGVLCGRLRRLCFSVYSRSAPALLAGSFSWEPCRPKQCLNLCGEGFDLGIDARDLFSSFDGVHNICAYARYFSE